MDKPQLWTKDFLIDSATNFFVYLVFYLLMAVITIYAMDNLQASPSEAGLASGIFIVAALFSRVLTGSFIERVGRKKMLYIGLTVFLLATFLYFGITSLPFLFLIRFLHGMGFGIASTATGTIVASIIPQGRRGEGIGYYALSNTLASAVGPFLGMYLHQHATFNSILVLCVSLLTVSYIVTFFLTVPEIRLTKEQLDKARRFSLYNLFEFKALPIAIIGALLGVSYSSILSFLTSYAKDIHLIQAGSFFFIVYAAAILISRPLTGRWFDTKGENFVMYPTFLLLTIGLMILSQAQQGLILLLAAVFVGFGWGTFISSGQAIAVKVSSPHRTGLATSTFFAITDGGMGIGPFFLGFLVPVIGFRGLYMAMSLIGIVCMCLYYVLYGKKAVQAKPLIPKSS